MGRLGRILGMGCVAAALASACAPDSTQSKQASLTSADEADGLEPALGAIPPCLDCIDAASVGPIPDEPSANSRPTLPEEAPTHLTLVERWSRLAQGNGTVALVRARVDSRQAARSIFAAGEAPTINTELNLTPLDLYCGSAPDPLVAHYRGGRLASGEKEYTSEMGYDLAVGEEYVVLLLGYPTGKLVIDGRHTVAVVGPVGMKTYWNRLDAADLPTLNGVCP